MYNSKTVLSKARISTKQDYKEQLNHSDIFGISLNIIISIISSDVQNIMSRIVSLQQQSRDANASCPNTAHKS